MHPKVTDSLRLNVSHLVVGTENPTSEGGNFENGRIAGCFPENPATATTLRPIARKPITEF